MGFQRVFWDEKSLRTLFVSLAISIIAFATGFAVFTYSMQTFASGVTYYLGWSGVWASNNFYCPEGGGLAGFHYDGDIYGSTNLNGTWYACQ